LRWINEKGIKEIEKEELLRYNSLRDLLQGYSNIKLIGVADETVGILSCIFDSYSADNVGQILAERNIAVRTGLHCSPYAHKFLGTFPAGTVRFSVTCFNTDQDIADLKAALDYIEENT
jgi:selenocysteine lyase/cysteine desulfurase